MYDVAEMQELSLLIDTSSLIDELSVLSPRDDTTHERRTSAPASETDNEDNEKCRDTWPEILLTVLYACAVFYCSWLTYQEATVGHADANPRLW